ncbi:unnamed protein product [Didymodactylos carnosus]|uniref:Uncharacterized protein n=1 Tax=Didymodactylos carnosus TaxID=1234261 RepID=A0A815V4Q2_9BILA|nr:unnamed protein product [Didymodactylos carnosus]CAF1527870.1 unnamed protein product [Didymodactylos carnosus]CAF4128113.1 unnamed protein product [Didymodactylos carnosus]CAF4387026.1 unnamed protein product [Didymodactylos carnosus]
MSHSHVKVGVGYSPAHKRVHKLFSATIVNKTSQPVTGTVLYTCDNSGTCQDQTLRGILNANGGELRANIVPCTHEGAAVNKAIKQIEIEKQDSTKMVLSAPFQDGPTDENWVFEVNDNQISTIPSTQ